MKHYNTLKTATQKGFTLIEVLIVVVILGLISSIAVPAFNNSMERAAAVKLIESFADNIADATRSLLVTTGAPQHVTNSALTDGSSTLLDVLIVGPTDPDGVAILKPKFLTDYEDSSVQPLSRQVTITATPQGGASAGTYELNNYAVTYSSPTTGKGQLLFTGVPEEVIKRIKESREADPFNGSTTDTTGPVQHSAVALGVADLTIEFEL